MQQPAWLNEAWYELGQRERAGSTDNARIIQLYRDAGHAGVAHDEVPWCAAFVGACLVRAGFSGTGSLMARSYAAFGSPLDGPRLGAIAVLSRGDDPSLGHVGFVVGATDGQLCLLGGNQGDAVTVAAFDRARVVAMRWPGDGDRAEGPATGGNDEEHSATDGFDRALTHVLAMEGGYTDDPHDPGGPTNKGILLRELAAWNGVTLDAGNRERLKSELREIPDETVRAIYRRRYWQPAGCESLPPPLALMHFDAAVNHGVGGAICMLQQSVGVEADGEIGPLTRAASAQSPVGKTVAAYADIRRRRYRALPHFWRFGRGWLNRVTATVRAAEALMHPTAFEDDQHMTGEQDMAKTNGRTAAEPKWWGRSMTIWGVVVTALSTVLPALGPLVGVELPADIVAETGGQVITAVQAIGGLIGSIMSIVGRIRASQPLARRELSLRL